MAMPCIRPGRLCDGCMSCQETAYTTCEGCGGEIHEGQDCYRMGNGYWCEDCVVPTMWEADDEY